MAAKGIPQRNTNRQLNLKFYTCRVQVISCQTEVEAHVQQWVAGDHTWGPNIPKKSRIIESCRIEPHFGGLPSCFPQG